MLNRLLLALPLLAAVACAEDDDAGSLNGEVTAPAGTVEVRPLEADGNHFTTNFAEDALDARVSNRDHWPVAADDATADGIDDDGDGAIDEDAAPASCACTDSIELAALAAETDDPTVCADNAFTESSEYGAVALAVFDSSTAGYVCQASYFDAPGAIFDNVYLTDLTEDEYLGCLEVIIDIQDAEGCTLTQ
jgi:hypothetical protein